MAFVNVLCLQRINIKTLKTAGLKWDLIKLELRGFSIAYAKRKASKQRSREKDLQNQLNALLANSKNSRNNPHYRHELRKLQAELNTFMEHKIKGTILRSEVRWHEKGEKNSRYFPNLENRAACKKKVTKLLLEDSTETNDPDLILKKQEEFFSNLFKSQGPSVEKSNGGIFFNSTNDHFVRGNVQ